MTKPRKKSRRSRAGRGRPSIYSEALGARICVRLAAGEPLRVICRDKGMPAEATVRSWGHDPKHVFSAQYARARELGFWSMADEMLEIADDSRNDWMEKQNKSGRTITVLNEEAIARSRLRIDARKWLIVKALPKDFGERLAAELSGKDGAPLLPEPSDRELARAIVDILRTAKIQHDASEEPEGETPRTNGHNATQTEKPPTVPPRRLKFNPKTGALE